MTVEVIDDPEKMDPGLAAELIAEGLTFKEFLTFLREKRVSTQCPSCYEREPGWTIYMYPKGNLVVPLGLGREVSVLGNGVGAIAMRCHNCGFIKLYDLAVVNEWKANAKRLSGKSDE